MWTEARGGGVGQGPGKQRSLFELVMGLETHTCEIAAKTPSPAEAIKKCFAGPAYVGQTSRIGSLPSQAVAISWIASNWRRRVSV